MYENCGDIRDRYYGGGVSQMSVDIVGPVLSAVITWFWLGLSGGAGSTLLWFLCTCHLD